MILLIFFLLMMPITFYWKKNLLIYQKDMILLLSENSERRKCILNIVFLLELQDFSLVIGIRIIVFVAGAEAKQFNSTTERSLKVSFLRTCYLSKNCTRSYCGRLQLEMKPCNEISYRLCSLCTGCWFYGDWRNFRGNCSKRSYGRDWTSCKKYSLL